MTWPFGYNPYGTPPQNVVFVPMQMPTGNPNFVGPQPYTKDQLKEFKRSVRLFKKMMEEEKKEGKDKKEDKKPKVDIVKVYTLLVLFFPVLAPLYVMWLKTLF